METEKRQKAEVISHLRKEIQALEGFRQHRTAAITTGISEIDQALPGGSLPLAAIHEFVTTNEDGPAASGFLSALISTLGGNAGAIIWIVKELNIFPASLTKFGLDPSRIIFIALPKPQEAMWAMEEALRTKEIVAAVCEVADPDLTATRRMQIAVEKSGVTGFLIRMNPKKSGSTSCVTRWGVQSLPSGVDNSGPGIGFPRWKIELLKVRNGQPGTWLVEWKENQFHLIRDNKQTSNQQPGRMVRAG